MSAGSNLFWLRLRRTSTKTDGCYQNTHDVALLPDLGEGRMSFDGSPAGGFTERWSPMFLVGDQESVSQFEKNMDGTIWLLFDTRPVQLAALIDNQIPAPSSYGLFLTHGMASVVLLLPHDNPAIDPQLAFRERTALRAVEKWSVERGIVTENAVLRDVAELDTEDGALALGSTVDLRDIVAHQMQDNNLAMQRIATLCAKYRPSFWGDFEGLTKRSMQLFNELRGSRGTGALMGGAYSLMHLNSMLSYCVSQGLSGHPPLLEYHGLLPTYSLFGVATAYQGVWNITHLIEQGFHHFDILTEMQNRYFNMPSTDYRTDVFQPALDEVKPGGNHTAAGDVTTLGHVNLFSGRLGFHSSTWAVAAPVHTLYAAANPDWNLLTLSHELLHVHVDGLLGFVLSPNPNEQPVISQDDLYVKMSRLAQQKAPNGQLPIIDRIRQKIARYVLQSAGCRGNDARPSSELPRTNDIQICDVRDASHFREMLRTYWRRLSEYIVHVLDFYYFYGGDIESSLALIWRSWDRIPSVYEDVGHYIMRSLLSVSTREMEPETELGTSLVEPLTFVDSLAAFEAGIKALESLPDAPEITSKIHVFLAVPENREYLRLEFDRSKSLAWMAVMYFYCRPLRLYFEIGSDFPGVLLDDGKLCPEFSLGEVQERLPISATAFLRKYLNSDYVQADGQEMSAEEGSLWLFSWLSSCGPLEGDSDAS